MSLRNPWLILCALVLTFVPSCRAPPIELNEAELSHALVAMTILRTILLGYLAHIATIRPELVGPTNSIVRRFQCFIFPSLGTAMAINSIYYAYNDEKILGTNQFKVPLEKYAEQAQNIYPKDPKQNTENQNPSGSSISPSTEIPKNQGLKVDLTNQNRHSRPSVSEIKYVGDWIVEYLKTNDNVMIKEYDNAAYLAAFLYLIGPEKAKKIKHCILNKHLILGFASAIYARRPRHSVILTEKFTVAGPGSECEYQTEIVPQNTRYLSIDMISQLRTACNIDSTSYIEICVTIGQAIYTTTECITMTGDKWTKSIMIIYTAMSILQTLSLIILHKQSSPFSLYYYKDIPWREALADNVVNDANTWRKVEVFDNDKERLSPSSNDGYYELLYEGSFLQFTIERREFKQRPGEDLWAQNYYLNIVISSIIGVGIPLLICIWADYNAKSITEWLVLSWILCSAILLLGIFSLKFNYHAYFVLMSICFIIIAIGGCGCLIAATIIGYLP
ncbi:hypothetical protein J3Q64DRAFT_1734108 [Phycomyces blakesleeanus]